MPTPTLTPIPQANPLERLNADVSTLLPVLRRLNLPQVPAVRLISRAEAMAFLEARMSAQGLKERVAQEKALYSTLGLIPQELDLYNLYLNLTLEQVSAFYDQARAELLVASQGDSVGAQELLFLSYAYGHLLQEQHFAVAELREKTQENRDAELALEALSQGDALLTMTQYGVLRVQRQDLIESIAPQQSSVLDQAPFAIRELFLFPFSFGADFVLALQGGSGWDKVNSAYDRPPVTTAQILHPARYLDGFQPVALTLPNLQAVLGFDWRQADQGVLGEFRHRLYLGQHLAGEEASAAAEGWSGDRYTLLKNSTGAHLLVVKTSFENAVEAGEFFQAFRRLTQKRRGWDTVVVEENSSQWRAADAYASVSIKGQEVIWLLAPTPEVGPRVEALVGL